MGAFFTAILAKIVSFAVWLILLVVAMFAAWWLLGTDLGCWIFEQILNVAITALNTVSFDAEMFNPGSYISAFPDELTNALGLLRVGECITIIASACVLKVFLQLIPFTRLGS
jgi:hypothetical protein